jgi:predicted MPP superfamily phosphohydrolase
LSDLIEALPLAAAAAAQWRMGVSWLRAAKTGAARRRRRTALAGYYAVLAAGVVAGFRSVASLPGAHLLPAALAGGASHLWLYASAGAYVMYEAARMIRKRLSPSFSPARRRLLNAAGGALAATPLAVVGYGAFVERTSFRVREIEVPLPNLAGDLEGLRLLQLSDIHLSAFLSEAELARVIDAANETRAHVALVTGDMISFPGDPLDACLRQIARLRADAGVLGCMGNHEDYSRAKEYASVEGARLGIRFLRSESRRLRFGSASIQFAGVDYEPISRRRKYLRHAPAPVAGGMLNVLLSHNPDVFPVAAARGWDLTLSGHTHGGQVTVEILDQSINPARFFTPFVYGLYRQGGRSSYVTRGIGTIGVPARIGAPPEIALLRLKRA